jgi:hypothetical protein
MGLGGFLKELQYRNAFKVAVACVAMGAALLNAITTPEVRIVGSWCS